MSPEGDLVPALSESSAPTNGESEDGGEHAPLWRRLLSNTKILSRGRSALSRSGAIRCLLDALDDRFILTSGFLTSGFEAREVDNTLEMLLGTSARRPRPSVIHFALTPRTVSTDDIVRLLVAKDGFGGGAIFVSWLNGFDAAAVGSADDHDIALYRLRAEGGLDPVNPKATHAEQKREGVSPMWSKRALTVLLGAFGLLLLLYIVGPFVFLYWPAPDAAPALSSTIESGVALLALLFMGLFTIVFSPRGSRWWRWDTNVAKATAVIAATVINVTVTFAAIFYRISAGDPASFDTGKPLTHLQALYFSVQTITTAGFGDLRPSSDATLAVVIGELTCTVIVVTVCLAVFASRLGGWMGSRGESLR